MAEAGCEGLTSCGELLLSPRQSRKGEGTFSEMMTLRLIEDRSILWKTNLYIVSSWDNKEWLLSTVLIHHKESLL